MPSVFSELMVCVTAIQAVFHSVVLARFCALLPHGGTLPECMIVKKYR